MNTSPIFLLPDLAATEVLAQKISGAAGAHEVLLLEGDLGTGKTTFARAFLLALGAQGDIPSPTFSLVQSYDLALGRVFHFDLYRLQSPTEIEEIGFDEACSEGLVLVEWPEKAKLFMPRDVLRLRFEMTQEGRRQVVVTPSPAWAGRLKGLFDAN